MTCHLVCTWSSITSGSVLSWIPYGWKKKDHSFSFLCWAWLWTWYHVQWKCADHSQITNTSRPISRFPLKARSVKAVGKTDEWRKKTKKCSRALNKNGINDFRSRWQKTSWSRDIRSCQSGSSIERKKGGKVSTFKYSAMSTIHNISLFPSR